MAEGKSLNNIFSLVRGKQEDQLSIDFGFVLKNYPKILDVFLRQIGISLNKKELKVVDIETQTTYNSGESRIDLHIEVPNRFLIFVESKIVIAHNIDKQLRKYSKILDKERTRFEGVRLVYINKYPISNEKKKIITAKLRLKCEEFSVFSWEELLRLTKPCENKEIIKLFNEYIGDSMNNKKYIGDQKIKNIKEVLVVFTNPAFWELTKKKNIAVQRNAAPDARYVAFLRTGRTDNNGRHIKSAITHVARVQSIESYVPIKEAFSGFSKLLKRAHERGWDSKRDTHKHYNLEGIVTLAHEIPHLGNKGMVNFSTTLGELLKAKSTKDIRLGQ